MIQDFWKFWSRKPKFPKTLLANFAFSKFPKFLKNSNEILKFIFKDFKIICKISGNFENPKFEENFSEILLHPKAKFQNFRNHGFQIFRGLYKIKKEKAKFQNFLKKLENRGGGEGKS